MAPTWEAVSGSDAVCCKQAAEHAKTAMQMLEAYRAAVKGAWQQDDSESSYSAYSSESATHTDDEDEGPEAPCATDDADSDTASTMSTADSSPEHTPKKKDQASG